MRYLGYNVSATTIRHILEANGIVPDPDSVIANIQVDSTKFDSSFFSSKIRLEFDIKR